MQASSQRWLVLVGLLAAAVLPGPTATRAAAQSLPPRRPSQAQAASQFLRAVLAADYLTAYRRLAPEVRRTVSFGHFEGTAHPIWKTGQQRHRAIELYKMGLRLGDGGGSRLFYDFSFAADSLLKPPPVLLEVTFRDTASRAILGFGMRIDKVPVRTMKPAGAQKR